MPKQAPYHAAIRLADGRRLGFAQYGDPDGQPILFFHGGGDSRLQRHPDDSIAERLGVRLVAVDRPGIGLSDFKRRRLVDWPRDVQALADELNLERFAVLGYSMGGPHALACAHCIPHRLTTVGVASGLGPFEWPGAMDGMSAFHRRLFRYASRSHFMVQIPLGLARREARRDPAAWVDRSRALITGPDRDIYDRIPGRRENQIEALGEVLKRSSRGLAWELAMATRPWGFRVEDITVPTLLWYGSEDTTTPARIGRELASRMPQARLMVFRGEAHQCIFVHWKEILEALL